jgi:hypothetical protein
MWDVLLTVPLASPQVAISQDAEHLYSLAADGTVRVWDASSGQALATLRKDGTPEPAIGASFADKLRKALDTPVSVDFKDKPTPEVLKDLQQKAPGIGLLVGGKVAEVIDRPIDLQLRDVPLGAVFQALEDLYPGLRFVVREYGILAASRAQHVSAPSLHEFWKGEKRGDKAKPAAEPKR